MVSATVRTRSSSSGERKNGRRKGQWTRVPNVSLALRILLNKTSGSADMRKRVDFRMELHSSAGSNGTTEGIVSLVIWFSLRLVRRQFGQPRPARQRSWERR